MILSFTIYYLSSTIYFIMKQKPVAPALQHFLEGETILIDKPLHWTSFDAVRKIRNLIGVKKVGHAGTLDPLATGLLIVCTGKSTKKINEYMGMEKEYTGTFTLGATTPTYDLESEPENFTAVDHLTKEKIEKATHNFTGLIQQTPPIFSAIKQEGQPVYLKARKGEDVILEPRPITIYAFEITVVELPVITFKIVCSTGTYIRSIANDFGKALGVGAYLSELRRTRIGHFSAGNAMSMESFKDEIERIKSEDAKS